MKLTKKYRIIFDKATKVAIGNPMEEYNTESVTETINTALDGKDFDSIADVEKYIETNELIVLENGLL